MRYRAPAIGLLLVAASCTGSTPAREQIITNVHDFELCCDAETTVPIKAGEFQIQIIQGQFAELDPATITATFTSELDFGVAADGPGHSPVIPVRLSLESGSPLALGSTTIEVWIDDCEFREVDVTIVAEVLGRRIDDLTSELVGIRREFKITNTCPPTTPPRSTPQRMAEAILGSPVADFDGYGMDTPTGVPTYNWNSTIPPQVPIHDYTETFQVGALVVELDQQQLDDAFTGMEPVFPVGSGSMGLTVPSDDPTPMLPGRYLLTWQCVVGDIPLDVGDQYLQFAFVADIDDDAADNYVAQPPFDFDPLTESDTGYVASYFPPAGWFFAVSDTQTGVGLPSSARLIIWGQVQFLVIPVSELGSRSSIPVRYSTFAHEGDLGQTGRPWSGDATAPVGDPRLVLSLQPSF